jgi:hypothetical protein
MLGGAGTRTATARRVRAKIRCVRHQGEFIRASEPTRLRTRRYPARAESVAAVIAIGQHAYPAFG